MPIKNDDLHERGELPTGEWRETDDVPVGHMVYNLAESIANAQTKLDLNAAEVAKTLDETEVEVVPRITQRVHEDGSVTTERADPENRTLLELGFTPSRYHFSEATIEVDFDTKMSEEQESSGKKNVGMRAGTAEARSHRKFNRSVETNTHVKAKLEPMAPPPGLSPDRNTQPAEEPSPGGGDDEGSADGADQPAGDRDRGAGDDRESGDETGGQVTGGGSGGEDGGSGSGAQQARDGSDESSGGADQVTTGAEPDAATGGSTTAG